MQFGRRLAAQRLAMAALLSCAALTLAAPAQAAAKKLPGEKTGVTQYKMQCTPQRAKSGDTLTIRFPAKHGGDFSVGNPKNELFSVAFTQPDRASSYQPVIAEDTFRTMSEFTVALAAFQGFPSYKPGPRRVIFRESGTYTLLVSPALETEDPVIEGWCKVRFAK